MNRKSLLSQLLLFVLILNTNIMNAQNNTINSESLNAQQQSLVKISALTSVGNLERLKAELNAGLDAGLTINEIKEVLVQLYAYSGFPRSLNGISNKEGKEFAAGNETGDKYEQGRKVLETLTKTPQTKPAPGFGVFAPRID